eukprot:GHVQ01008929.1.p1 GENE.GHVQ01008929.1~~GHVQ01008929.1.p1  ORF type:complete len:402 (-),score=21.96 GHVQ01008929.1:244-1449(-)
MVCPAETLPLYSCFIRLAACIAFLISDCCLLLSFPVRFRHTLPQSPLILALRLKSQRPCILPATFLQRSQALLGAKASKLIVPPRRINHVLSDAELRDFLRKAHSESHKRKHQTVQNSYEKAAQQQLFPPWPLDGRKLLCFVAILVSESKAYTTVADYANILCNIAKRGNNELSISEKETFRLALLGAGTLLGKTTPRRAITLSAAQLKVLSQTVHYGNDLFEAVTMGFLLGVFALLRRSEAVQFRAKDIVLASNSVTIFLRESKTDKFRVGYHIHVGCIVGAPLCNESICPVHRLKCFLEKLQQQGNISDEEPLFSVTPQQFSEQIKHFLTTVFPNDVVGRLSTHSMRRTGVSLMLAGGIPLHQIAQFGRWADTKMVSQVYSTNEDCRQHVESGHAKCMV